MVICYPFIKIMDFKFSVMFIVYCTTKSLHLSLISLNSLCLKESVTTHFFSRWVSKASEVLIFMLNKLGEDTLTVLLRENNQTKLSNDKINK